MDENLRKARMAQCFSWLDQLIYKYHSFIQCFSQSFVSLDKSNIFLHYLENFALCMIYNCSHWKASKLAARGRGFRPPPKWMLNYIIFLWRASFNFLKPNECYTSWLKNENNSSPVSWHRACIEHRKTKIHYVMGEKNMLWEGQGGLSLLHIVVPRATKLRA